MYTTTILDRQTGEPTTDIDTIGRIADYLGNGAFGADDAELGIWLVNLDSAHEEMLEARGVLEFYLLDQFIFIEMP